MRRRIDTAGDSLELLLDAVTNAFGGILFLAILIVILVNRTPSRSGKTAEAATRTSADIVIESDSIKAKVQSLSDAIREQEKSLDRLQFNEDASLYENVIDMQRRISQLEKEREEFVLRNKDLLQKSQKTRDSQSQLELQVRERETQKASLEEELARLRLPQVRTAKTPRLRRTYKKEFPLMLRYGRVYFPYTLDESTGNKTFNEEEFILIDDSVDSIRVTPKPYRGVLVEDTRTMANLIAEKFKDFDADDYYIAIAAWSDSFADFNELRNAVVNLGFEYRIIPVEPGGFIQEGAVRESLVQ